MVARTIMITVKSGLNGPKEEELRKEVDSKLQNKQKF